MLTKIVNSHANNPFLQTLLTNSFQFVSKIAEMFAVYPLTNNIIIISDQNIGNDFHGSIYIISYSSKPHIWLWPPFVAQDQSSMTTKIPD